MERPGVVPATLWRPDPDYDRALFPDVATRTPEEAADATAVSPLESLIVGGLARKP